MLVRLHKHIRQLITLVALLSVVSPVLSNDTLTLNFGVHSNEDATSVVRMYRPALKVLKQSMTATLNRTVDMRMHIANEHAQGENQLRQGFVDFASLDIGRYLDARSLNSDLGIMAARNSINSTHLTPWVARPGMHDSVFLALRESILTLKSSKVLTTLKAYGFVQSHDSQYENHRKHVEFTTTKTLSEATAIGSNSGDTNAMEPAVLGARAAVIQNDTRNRNKYNDRKQCP